MIEIETIIDTSVLEFSIRVARTSALGGMHDHWNTSECYPRTHSIADPDVMQSHQFLGILFFLLFFLLGPTIPSGMVGP